MKDIMGIGLLRKGIILAITLLSIAIFILFFQYDTTLEKATERSKEIVLNHVKKFGSNLEEHIRALLKEDLKQPFSLSKELRTQLEEKLTLFVGEQYPYVYIISRDENRKFRYIVDGSTNQEEKGEYKQKFDPASDVWMKVFEAKSPKWQIQDTISGLWMTYLHPIVENNEVMMIIAFDFSTKEFELLNNMFSPIRNSLLIISWLLCILLVISYAFIFLFYRQKRKTAIDSLTNLFNRHFLDEVKDTMVLDHIAVAVIDLDYFKKVNDSYGHLVGDEVLKELAKRLKESIRAHDIIIRYGGEEFLLFLNIKKNQANPYDVTKRIQHEVCKNPIIVDGNIIPITFSIGLNPKPSLNRSLRDAIDAADKMLYLAKTNGRNRIEVYEEKNLYVGQSHVDMVMDAIEDGRLKAYFQPIANTKTKECIAYEALVRLVDTDGEVNAPYKFLPYIKETRAYREMSKTMLRYAFDAIDKHGISVHVNFDTGDFFDETLMEIITEEIKSRQEIASKLTFELLEDREIKDFYSIRAQIDKLKDLGVHIAIDDFGSGYSTFSYLLEIEPDSLKIDGSLICRLGDDKHAREIVKSILNVCETLHIKTVAEFVENDTIIHELEKLGVDFLQGYAIGKPSQNINIPSIK